MTDCTDVVYAKNKTELLWLIKPGMIYDENRIGQQRDQSYRSSVRQNLN